MQMRGWFRPWSVLRSTQDGGLAASTPQLPLESANDDPIFNRATHSDRGQQPRQEEEQHPSHNSVREGADNAACTMTITFEDKDGNGSGWENIAELEHDLESTYRLNVPRAQETQNWRNGSPTIIESRQSSPSWGELRIYRSEVIRLRVQLQDLDTRVQSQRRKIDDDEARLLPALLAASSNSDLAGLQDMVIQFQKLVELRERWKPEAEELRLLQEKLIAQEADLSEMEQLLYGDPENIDLPDFPSGGFDFTGESASSHSEVLPEQQTYELRLEEVNTLRERIMDLTSEHDQLLREQERRSRIRRNLDEYSAEILSRFETDLESLSLQLNHAEDQLMLAEASLSTRKRTLEQEKLSLDPPRDPPSPQLQISSRRASFVSISDDEDFYENEDTSPTILESGVDTTSRLVNLILKPEEDEEGLPVFRVPSSDSNGETVNMARFINQWLLQRLQQVPREAVRFTQALADNYVDLEMEDLPDLVLSLWARDGLEEEFIIAVEAAENSYTGSMAPNNGLAQILNDRAQSHRLAPSPPGSVQLSRRNSRRLVKTETKGVIGLF